MVGIVKSSYISSTLETCLMKSKSFAFSINVVECLFVLFFDDFMLGNLLPFVEFSPFHIEDNSTSSVYMACRAVS